MPTRTVVDTYFDAFNRHDPEAVAALFARGGTYIDSAVSSGVKGKALKGYLRVRADRYSNKLDHHIQ